ncbi:hypothetical protein D3C87_1086630 [compost metagenome]
MRSAQRGAGRALMTRGGHGRHRALAAQPRHQPLLLQPGQCGPHRHPRHAEFLGQLAFAGQGQPALVEAGAEAVAQDQANLLEPGQRDVDIGQHGRWLNKVA